MRCDRNKVVPEDDATLVNVVNEAYSKIGREGVDQAYADRVANAFGYSSEQLQSVPAEAHVGLSCGNPVATATIREGETVVDLGAGGGMDVFLAAAKAGPAGQVIGLDNSDDMIARARRNAATRGLKPPRVAFVKASLAEDLPIESSSVDCVLSNCVINLLPPAGKLKVIQEVYRILKPGGRVAIDDIIAKKLFPDSLRSNVASYAGYFSDAVLLGISGAILFEDYQKMMREAGFQDVIFTENHTDLNVYGQSGDCGTPAPSDVGDLNEWAKACHIYATKSKGSASASPVPGSALKNWWDAYPVGASSPSHLECEEVADLIRNPERGEKDLVVIDVRGDDHTGGHVRGSVQQPAQTFYDYLPEFYEKHKETARVVFYCNSSNGQGPRCAKWYQDYLDQQGNTKSEAFILTLTGGAKKWVSLYKEQKDLVDFD